MRLIDADAFALYIVDHLPRTAPQEVYDAYFDVMRMLKDEKATPTADVVEAVRCEGCIYNDAVLRRWARKEKTDDR